MDKQILAQLEAPFAEVSWKIQAMSKDNTKGMCVAYIDARDVAERLDSIGLEWSDSYIVLQMATSWVVECKLTINGITRTDVGTGDGEEAPKSAYSDAFKRAAVKFGLGRYLYSIPTVWMPVENRQITADSLSKLQTAYNRHIGKQAVSTPAPTQPAPAYSPQPVIADTAPATGKPISDAQVKLLAFAMKQMGFESTTEEDRAETRAFLAWMLGLPGLGSIKELTSKQAGQVITAISAGGDKFSLNEDAAGKAIDDWNAYRAEQASRAN